MNVWDKIRIKRKIHKVCQAMQARMSEKDVCESVGMIKGVLHLLPHDRKEGLLDVCLKVLKNGK